MRGLPSVQTIFQWLYDQSLGWWTGFSLVNNLFVCAVSITACWFLQRRFADRKLFETPQPLSWGDGLLALGAMLLNSGVSVVGWLLWKSGWITLTFPPFWRVCADALLLLFIMDLAMYVSHRLAHLPMVYPVVHRLHHTHESTNPISLFVLNPFEVMGFGGLMIGALCVYSFSAVAVVIYLTLNLIFGTLGHVGAEVLPPSLARHLMLRQLGTSTFHGGHHADPKHNFGFYTVVWDRLLGTLSDDYDERVQGRRARS